MRKLSLCFIVFAIVLSFAVGVEARKKRQLSPKPTVSNIINLVIEGDFKRAGKMVLSLEKRLEGLNDAERSFILGYVEYELGNYKKAKDLFIVSSGHLLKIADHVKYFLADSCLKVKSYNSAVSGFKSLLENYPESVWFQEACWGLAQAYYKSEKYSEALSLLSKVSLEDSNGPSDSEYNLFKAELFQKLGKSNEAANIYRTIYFSAESDRYMKKALDALKRMGTAESKAIINNIDSKASQILLAEQLIRRGRYGEGLSRLEKLYKAQENHHMAEVLASAYFKSRYYEKAKKMYQKLVSDKKGRGSLHYLMRLAKSSARTDDFEIAIETYKKILKKHSKGKTKITALYKLGFLYMDSKQYDKAVGYFQDLLDLKYKGHLRKSILWNVAWCYYKMEKYDKATGYLETLSKSGFGKNWDTRALFWIAKCYEKMGQKDKAKKLYAEIISKNRFNYYGFLSAKSLSGELSIPKEWVALDPQDIPEATLPLQEGLAKAEYLYDLGLYRLANMELKKFERRSIAGSEGSISFMEFAKKCGDYRAAHLTAVERFKYLLHSFPNSEGLRRFIWNSWYPEAYSSAVKKYSKEYEITDLLAYSIMREESRFQPEVVSKADAIGLMQIIPPTAMKLAEKLDVNSFEVKDMYVPEINIRFSIKYLSDLSKLFDGEITYMIASYNAGEDAVSRWVKNSDAKDISEFIEEIPYSETNGYVKRVLKSYWIYSSLYTKKH